MGQFLELLTSIKKKLDNFDIFGFKDILSTAIRLLPDFEGVSTIFLKGASLSKLQ